MRSIFRPVLLTLALACVAVGPAFAAPRVSLHSPTLARPSSDRAPASPWSLAPAGGPVLVGAAIKIRDLGALAQKFVRNAGNATPDYTAGVQNAGNDWETNTKAAEPNYQAGVQDAIGRGAFGKGVTGSSGKYQTNAVKLGAVRYQPGIANAQGAWQAGFQPYAQVLTSLNLPPKGQRRSPANQARANAVALALGNAKTGKA